MNDAKRGSPILRWIIGFVSTFIVVAAGFFWYFSRLQWDDSEPPPAPKPKDKFTWSHPVHALYQASILPPKEAVTHVFQNIPQLRAYAAIQIQSAAAENDVIRKAPWGDPHLEQAITSKLNEIVEKSLRSENGLTSVDCVIDPALPFPFTVVTAMKYNARPIIVVNFGLPERSGVTMSSIKKEMGAPRESVASSSKDSYIQWKYQTKTASYEADTTFDIDAAGQGKSVTILVQRLPKKASR